MDVVARVQEVGVGHDGDVGPGEERGGGADEVEGCIGGGLGGGGGGVGVGLGGFGVRGGLGWCWVGGGGARWGEGG